MSLDRCGVDQHLGRRTTGRRQRMKDVDPDALGRPAHEAIVERLARTVDDRGVDPATARLQHMHDTADDPAIIHSRFATCIGGKMRLKPRELSFVQPETVPIHQWSPFGDLESRNGQIGNPVYGSGP